VIPGMIANRMSPLGDLPHEFRVPLSGLADHEKGRACLIPLQEVEQPGRILGMRPIIKRERGDRVPGSHAGNGSRHIVPNAVCFLHHSSERFEQNPDTVSYGHVPSSLPTMATRYIGQKGRTPTIMSIPSFSLPSLCRLTNAPIVKNPYLCFTGKLTGTEKVSIHDINEERVVHPV